MKKVLALVAAAAILAVGTTALASDIKNTKHNLSSSGPVGTNGDMRGSNSQICVYCHTPHNAYTEAPLWNRNQSTVIAASAYKLYSGLNMSNISNKSGFTSDSVSLFCMSCHDGSVLGGTMLKNTPTTEAGLTSGARIPATASTNLNKSGELRTTHPVNFNVAIGSQTVQNDLADINSGFIQDPNNATKYPLFKSSRSATNTLECSSCHSVHDNANTPFLRNTMTGSTLCLGCHRK